MRRIGAQQQIDLVLQDQALRKLDQLVGLTAVVIRDHLDRDFLVELLQRDAAGIVHALVPKLVLRDGVFRARSQRPGYRDRVADPDLVRRGLSLRLDAR